MMPAPKKLLPLLALLPHAAATSMKIDYLRLANVRTDPITHPDGPSSHVHSLILQRPRAAALRANSRCSSNVRGGLSMSPVA